MTSDELALAVGALGTIGTLSGVALGAVGSWLIHKRQLSHENRTRFHDLRLRVYADFTGATNQFKAGALTGHWDSIAATKLIESFEQLQMCASMEVVEAATRVHALTALIQPKDLVQSAKSIEGQLPSAIAQFLKAARQELDLG